MFARNRLVLLEVEEVEHGWCILMGEGEDFLAMAPAENIGPTMDRVGPRNVRGFAFNPSSFAALVDGIRRLGPAPGGSNV